MCIFTWKSDQPVVFAHVAAAKAMIAAGDTAAPRTVASTIAVTSSSSRRVCGESSSSERPRASCASWLAISMSSDRHFDILDALAVVFGVLDLALVLMQQRQACRSA